MHGGGMQVVCLKNQLLMEPRMDEHDLQQFLPQDAVAYILYGEDGASGHRPCSHFPAGCFVLSGVR